MRFVCTPIFMLMGVLVLFGFFAPVPALCSKDTEPPESQDSFGSTEPESPGLHSINPEETIQTSAVSSSSQRLEDSPFMSSDSALSPSLKSPTLFPAFSIMPAASNPIPDGSGRGYRPDL